MHYYNDSIGKAVSNASQCKWHSALDTTYKGKSLGDKYIDITDLDPTLVAKDQETVEIIHISNETTDTAETTGDYEKYILEATRVDNPKYDMLFVYEGLGYFNYKNQKGVEDTSSDYAQKTQLYFDKMKRVHIKPWFFHSTYHSLRAAMSKAETLVDLYGKDNILVGKEVDLTQYIDIV
jgi:hypothetical protein